VIKTFWDCQWVRETICVTNSWCQKFSETKAHSGNRNFLSKTKVGDRNYLRLMFTDGNTRLIRVHENIQMPSDRSCPSNQESIAQWQNCGSLRGVSIRVIVRKALCQVTLFFRSGQQALETCQGSCCWPQARAVSSYWDGPSIARVATTSIAAHPTTIVCVKSCEHSNGRETSTVPTTSWRKCREIIHTLNSILTNLQC
jgi:hypothetical protein